MAMLLALPAIPGVREPLVIGSLLAFRKDPLGLLVRFAGELGDVGQFHYGPRRVYLFNSPELVRSVLVEHADAFDKGVLYHNAVRPVVGNGLINAEGEFWRGQRKRITPSFQPRQISAYAETMAAYSEQQQQGWAEGAVIDIVQEMTALTMRIVGKVLFDSEVVSETDELGAASSALLHWVGYTVRHFFPIPLSWPTPRNRRTHAALALIHGQVQAMIAERRASPIAQNDFLSILLRAQADDGTRMSDAQVRDEAATLFLAGYESTATTLGWTFYLLVTHPAIYTRVQQEVDSILQGRTPTYADLPRLPYTLAVFKETLRLYPPGWIINRVALREVTVAGIPLRKNQTVMMSVYTIHRRPEFYPDPERFDPDRFLPENEKRLPRYAYLPFGAGPRICIGNHFALLEAHLILATLVQRVEFDLVPGQQIVPEPVFTIRQKPGCRVVVRRRAT